MYSSMLYALLALEQLYIAPPILKCGQVQSGERTDSQTQPFDSRFDISKPSNSATHHWHLSAYVGLYACFYRSSVNLVMMR